MQPWRFVYEQLQQRLHRHRMKAMGVGLTWKDRNLTGALEWEEADGIDAELFAVLASHRETGRPTGAVRPQVSRWVECSQRVKAAADLQLMPAVTPACSVLHYRTQ